MTALTIKTQEGEFTAYYTENGLARLDFPLDSRPAVANNGAVASSQIRAWHELTERALKAALAGQVSRDLPPLDNCSGTEFQRRVWAAMRRIPAGRTRSYGELAKEIGNPAATRAVGGACGANPIPVLVPCHRVLAANRRLGGFSGGLDWKRKLLAVEGVAVE